MRALSALVLLAFGFAAPAEAATRYLAFGTIEEHGRGVRGHGRVLAKALAYELSHTGVFTLVADDAAKKAAIARIHRTNRHSVDEHHWVKVGKAVGATHLLLGEVRQDRNVCSAFAQLVHLESRETKVTQPAYYDCTNYDLVELAGELAEQLVGRRASAADPRRRRRPPGPVVSIVMRGRAAKVDGHDYTFYDLERGPKAAPDAGAAASTPSDDAEPAREDPVDAPPPTEPPSAEPSSPTPADTRPAPKPDADVEPGRWRALRPTVDDEGRPVFNLYALARVVDRNSSLVAGLVLAVPVLFLLLGALLLRARETAGAATLRLGLTCSVLLAAADITALLLFHYGLGRPLISVTDPFLVAAPLAALAMWLLGGRIMRVLPHLNLLRQLMWLFVLTAVLGAVLLVATQVQAPVAYFGLVLLLLWLGLRIAVKTRRRRKRY